MWNTFIQFLSTSAAWLWSLVTLERVVVVVFLFALCYLAWRLWVSARDGERSSVLAFTFLINIIVVVLICKRFYLPTTLTIFRFWVFWGGWPVFFVGNLAIMYLWWGKRDICFTFVLEGFGKIFLCNGGVVDIFINHKTRKMDDGFNIDDPNDPLDPVATKGVVPPALPATTLKDKAGRFFGHILRPRRIMGSFYFYGIYPFSDIYIHHFKWRTVESDGTVKSRDEYLPHFLVKDYSYFIMVDGLEDKDLVPLHVELVVTLRVANPYKSHFNVQDWLDTITARTKGALRNAITAKPYKNWIRGEKDLAEIIWGELKDEFFKDECLGRYGIKVHSMEVVNIDPGHQFREKTMAQFLADAQAIEKVTLAKAEKIARSQKGMALVMEMLSELTGMKDKEIHAKLKSNLPELTKASIELTKLMASLDAGARKEYAVEGLDGLTKVIEPLIKALKL